MCTALVRGIGVRRLGVTAAGRDRVVVTGLGDVVLGGVLGFAETGAAALVVGTFEVAVGPALVLPEPPHPARSKAHERTAAGAAREGLVVGRNGTKLPADRGDKRTQPSLGGIAAAV